MVECGGFTGLSLVERLGLRRGLVKIVQHDPAHRSVVWDEVRRGCRAALLVKGRILTIIGCKGREAAALIAAGAIDGLSIRYLGTVKAG